MSSQALAEVIQLIDNSTISGKIAKQILPNLLKVHTPPLPIFRNEEYDMRMASVQTEIQLMTLGDFGL